MSKTLADYHEVKCKLFCENVRRYSLTYSLPYLLTYLLTHSLTQVGVGSERSPDVRGRARCSSQANDRQSLFPQDITVFCMYLSTQFCFSLIFQVFILITNKIILYLYIY